MKKEHLKYHLKLSSEKSVQLHNMEQQLQS